MKGNDNPRLDQTVVFESYSVTLPVNEAPAFYSPVSEAFSSNRLRVSKVKRSSLCALGLEKPANPQKNLHSLRPSVVRI